MILIFAFFLNIVSASPINVSDLGDSEYDARVNLNQLGTIFYFADLRERGEYEVILKEDRGRIIDSGKIKTDRFGNYLYILPIEVSGDYKLTFKSTEFPRNDTEEILLKAEHSTVYYDIYPNILRIIVASTAACEEFNAYSMFPGVMKVEVPREDPIDDYLTVNLKGERVEVCVSDNKFLDEEEEIYRYVIVKDEEGVHKELVGLIITENTCPLFFGYGKGKVSFLDMELCRLEVVGLFISLFFVSLILSSHKTYKRKRLRFNYGLTFIIFLILSMGIAILTLLLKNTV